MENYLPTDALVYAIKEVSSSLTDEEINKVEISDGDWPKWEKYHNMIARKFQNADLGSVDDKGNFKPKLMEI